MSTSRASRIVTLALLAVCGAFANVRPAEGSALVGKVTTADSPLSAAGVYAYQLADMSLQKVVTDGQGRFLFAALPAGLYKIIASKPGFLPAVVLLTRATAEARQFVTVELTAAPAALADNAESFWKIRQEIPGDVLRQIDTVALSAATSNLPPQVGAQFETEMSAIAGVDENARLGASQLSGGSVDVHGALGEVNIGIAGDFRELQSEELWGSGSSAYGESQSLTFDLQRGNRSQVRLTSMNNRLVTRDQDTPDDVNLQYHQVSWTQPIGKSARSDFSARYLEESNFYLQGPIELLGVPQASRTWRVEGSFAAEPSDRTTLRTGFRYRERQSDYGYSLADEMLLPEERMELFGDGGLQVKPAVLVEYGLYSTMRDGSLSLAPRGGVIFQLGKNWQASTFVSQMLQGGQPSSLSDFVPAFVDDYQSCEFDQDYCYRLLLSRVSNDARGKLSIGAIHRKFADTLRLYFDDDFFNHVESLYLVRGDKLPELQFAYSKRIGKSISTRLESNVAAGGGGILFSADSAPYENSVRYLITSLDTQFESTSTGVFVAFHRLEQELNPINEASNLAPQMALERLQLMLTQDLSFLSSLASEWAVHLNMELSRGTNPDTSSYDDEDLRKRLTGGVAVKF